MSKKKKKLNFGDYYYYLGYGMLLIFGNASQALGFQVLIVFWYLNA